MKIVLVSLFALGLAGCQTTQRTVPVVEFQKIEISSQFLDCDGKRVAIPDPKKLTNKQISSYIIQMTKLLEECQTDVASIKKYVEEYNQEITKINERSKNAKI